MNVEWDYQEKGKGSVGKKQQGNGGMAIINVRLCAHMKCLVETHYFMQFCI